MTNLIEALNWEISMNVNDDATSVHNYYYQYRQAYCHTNTEGYRVRIYRDPNHDGRPSSQGGGNNNWGGMCFRPLSIDSNLLQKGHRYAIRFHVSGVSCDGFTPSWTNNMGWQGGGLVPSPSNVVCNSLPSNFSGEREMYYLFTINDDVYKTCTSSYSSFVAGNVYPSYRDFVMGFSYTQTNSVGTDIYLSNFGMYDITNTQLKVSMSKFG